MISLRFLKSRIAVVLFSFPCFNIAFVLFIIWKYPAHGGENTHHHHIKRPSVAILLFLFPCLLTVSDHMVSSDSFGGPWSCHADRFLFMFFLSCSISLTSAPHFSSEDLYIPWGFLFLCIWACLFAWRWSAEMSRWLNAYLLVGEGETITPVYMMLLCFSVR